MPKLKTKAEVDKLVLKYILKKAKNGFNPLDLTTKRIAYSLKLELNKTEEALSRLSGDKHQEEGEIEKLTGQFEFYIPITKQGEKIKEELFLSKFAFSNIALGSLILIIIFYYITKFITSTGDLLLTSFGDWFFVGAILAAITIFFVKKVSRNIYFITKEITKVQYYRVYVWVLIISGGLFAYAFSKGLHKQPIVKGIVFYISLAASCITILVFIINFFRSKSKNK